MKQLLQQALDALEPDDSAYREERVDRAIDALRAELATPDHEPIAYIFQKFCSDRFGGGWEERIERKVPSYYTTKNIQPLYAAPPEPEGCLSNCDTCTYAWGSPANPGH